ncbi:MAG TPA: glycosyltransferase [Candidatus Paceibacterota bacterium]|nr:glycosyltransferase [Candidatus Paceibacterota bacterium]
MKLLICTQVVDRNDPYLGFFHAWVEEFSKHFEQITVICLKEGAHALPQNVRIMSLGKEKNTSRPTRLWRLVRYAIACRSDYDAVFVHMNQEYILAAGWLWKLFGKRIYMWRNHYAGSLLTDIAALFCTHVFCTSRFSYTAKYRKTELMPTGVDTALYRDMSAGRTPRSILFYARMSPSKRPDMLVEALGILRQKGLAFSADIYGTPLPKDEEFLQMLKRRVDELRLADAVKFYLGTAPAEGPAIFSAHEIFVNLGASGMYDKTLFEAAACGCLVLAASRDWAQRVGGAPVTDERSLAAALEKELSLSETEREEQKAALRRAAQENSLSSLGGRLASAMRA